MHGTHTLLLFGATGMVGSEVLHLALDDARVGRVISVGRRATGVTHAKLEEHRHDDFGELGALEPLLRRADACIHCLGVYQGQVPTDEFWHITYGYVDALVTAFERTRPDVRFVLMGAQGADPTERSPFLFAKAKGRAEQRLTASTLIHRHIFRPGYIKPGRTASRASMPTWFADLGYRLFPFLGVEATGLACTMLEVAVTGAGRALYSNAEIKAFAAALQARIH